MSRSKQNKGKTTSDGKHRKETKEERRLRLQQQEEAREACLKMVPYVGGGILVLILLFGLYVRSVPPAVRNLSMDNFTIPGGEGIDTMKINMDDVRADLLNAETSKKDDSSANEGEAAGDSSETIEL